MGNASIIFFTQKKKDRQLKTVGLDREHPHDLNIF